MVPNTADWLLIAFLAAAAAGAQAPKPADLYAKGAHTGPVETTLCGVTTRFRDRRSGLLEERHGSGMVLRCDGFVLFSAAMLDHRADEPDDIRPDIEITLRPGTPDERRLIAPWPKSIPSNLSFRLVKLKDVHVPALRTLLPVAVKRGDPLTVAWLPWDDKAARFGPIERRALHYAPLAKSPREAALAGFDDAPEGAAPGAVVVGPEGMAVGMIAGRAGEEKRTFVSTESLARVTNCVVPVPTTDAEFAARYGGNVADAGAAAAAALADPPPAGDPPKPDAAPPGGQEAAARGAMIKVPGGPVVLPRAIRDSEIEMENGAVACVAAFQLDRYEVTNKEYWNFWSSLPEKTSAEEALRRAAWPAGWSTSPTPFTADLADVPVLGVTLAGAQAYARAQGKRLPTPYEWALAALGPDGDARAPEWIAQYIADQNDTALRIKKAHFAFLQQYPEIHGDDFLSQSTRLHTITFTRIKVRQKVVTVAADQRIHAADFMIGLPWIISPLLGFAPEMAAGGGFFDGLNGVDGLDIPLRLKMQRWSKALIESETQGLWDKWKAPRAILPVGSRSFDVGPYGASDLIWNGAELVAPPATSPAGLSGFAVSVTMMHPQDLRVMDDLLLVTGPNVAALAESYPSSVPYPLSRLIARSPGFPVAQWLWFQNNLEEARSAMRVLNGWQVNMLPAAPTVEVRTDNHSPFVGQVFYDNYPLYRDWAKPSPHTRQEIGDAVPLPAEEPLPMQLVPRDSGATLSFLVPIGFRCAR